MAAGVSLRLSSFAATDKPISIWGRSGFMIGGVLWEYEAESVFVLAGDLWGTPTMKVLRKKSRRIELVYRDWAGPFVVASLQEEVRLRNAAWLKRTNVGGDLNEMRFEHLIYPVPETPLKGRCLPEVLEKYNTIRAEVGGFLEASGGEEEVMERRGAICTTSPKKWLSIAATGVPRRAQ